MMQTRSIAAALTLVVFVGCAAPPPPAEVDRHARLLSLASAEAGQIANANDRLKRQLNFADRQLNDAHPAECRQSLAAAADTLRAAKPDELPARIRIAGWVSISELSRLAKDDPTAAAACDQGVATLRSLDPVADRPQFAVGVAVEVWHVHGKPPAAGLLAESAGWAKEIKDADLRRLALASIADAIFDCDAYDAGLAALRNDPDPAWRSDTLAMLAGDAAVFTDQNGNVVANSAQGSRQLDWASSVGNASVPGTFAAEKLSVRAGVRSPAPSAPLRQPFGQSVDYESVFGSNSR